MPREAFEAMVARIVEYVHAGDAFQVVPSQRWTAEVEADPFSVYRGLRAINPSPYMYFLDFEDFQIVGASPEPLVTVSGGRATTRPIAGTRPRGGDADEDEAIAADLLADEKERAEHVMLVDLGRNDLGRVCEFGSVEVETFMAVETYSHLIHIVSSVAGRLRPDVGPMDALRSILPAGTLSGAPKVRAMQIIDELEPVKRGAYGGAVGYLSYSGELDTCICIRTVVMRDGRAHMQAGGGTVADAQARLRVRGVPQQGPGGRARDRAGHEARGVAVSTKVLVVDNYDSFTYNLVQYLGELGAEPEVVRNDVETTDELLARRPDRVIVSPGPCTPERGGRLRRGHAPLPGGRGADARRLPRAPVARAGLRRHASSATCPCTARRPRSRTPARACSPGCPSPLQVGRYHSLVVEPSLPDALVIDRDGRRRGDGGRAPRAARVRRPVPPRVGAHARREEAAGELPCRNAGSRPDRAIDALASRRDLTTEQTAGVLAEIMAGNASEPETAAVLIALRTKGETVDELVGLAATMRRFATPVTTGRGGADRHRGHGRRPPDVQRLHDRRADRRGRRLRRRQARQPLRHRASPAPPTCSRRSA